MAVKKDGYVALLDVLGFSERVARGSLDGLDSYVDTVLRVANTAGVSTILFSDTVVLFTTDDTEDSFNRLLGVTCLLLQDLIAEGIPVRGAISHGAFVRTDNATHGTVIAGRPIIEAHHYEARLQWIGVMLAPSVLAKLPSLTVESCSLASARAGTESERLVAAIARLMVQPCRNIPLEDGAGDVAEFDGFAVVPTPGMTPGGLRTLRDSLDRFRAQLERLKQLAPDARSQRKYQRTIAWISEVRRNFNDALGDLVV